MSYIHAIGTAVPPHTIRQEQAAEWMAHALGIEGRERKMLDSLYASTGILTRHTVLEDYTLRRGNFSFFPNTDGLEPFPTVAARMQLYRNAALPLALDAIRKALEESATSAAAVTHLIVASCTGMYAPGLDIDLVEALGIPSTAERTLVQFMGCYAAFNALKLAGHITRSEINSCVLVVCVELCTLHFQKGWNRDTLVSNALFSDGAAAAIVKPEKGSGTTLDMKAFHCDLALDNRKDMAWLIANHGFEMTLSADVPHAIQSRIKELALKLLAKLGNEKEAADHYAIHPGGRRILEVIEEALGLERSHNSHAYEVLQENGNMSSATVFFVLEKLMQKKQPEINHGEQVLSFAFGPGLTLESMMLNVCKA
jgi:predicted naringenin-chalcone synthase